MAEFDIEDAGVAGTLSQGEVGAGGGQHILLNTTRVTRTFLLLLVVQPETTGTLQRWKMENPAGSETGMFDVGGFGGQTTRWSLDPDHAIKLQVSNGRVSWAAYEPPEN